MGGEGGRGAEKIFGGAQINFFLNFGSEDPQKTVFDARLLVFLVFGTKPYSPLEGHRQYLGGAQGPKMRSMAPGCYFLLGHNSRLGRRIFRLGAQAMIWGARPQNAPPGAGSEPP